MAEMPKSVAVSIELNDETVQQIKQLIREEMAMFAADTLTAAVDRRDRWRISSWKTSPNGRKPMTDPLRDKIAAVLADHLTDDYVAGKCACGEKTDDGHSTHQADAVIRELKLEVEDGECGYCQAQLPGCRYSTWVDDE